MARLASASHKKEKGIKYIQHQHEHHAKRSFKEEFLEFLVQYGIKYDERYLWD